MEGRGEYRCEHALTDLPATTTVLDLPVTGPIRSCACTVTYLYSRGRYATGESEVSSYQAGEAVGEGVRWSADGKSAWRLHDGEVRTFLLWPSHVARYTSADVAKCTYRCAVVC